MSGQDFHNSLLMSYHYNLHEFPASSAYDHFNNPASVTSSETGNTFPSSDSSETALVNVKRNTRKGPRGGVVHPFPSKLHQLLESNEFDEIISWHPNGRSFILHDAQGFVDSVMPLYFKQTKFRSFQRQLNLYNFKRITSGPDKGGYYHPMFLRGETELCNSIRRTSVKSHGSLKTHTNDDSNSDARWREHHAHRYCDKILQNTFDTSQNRPVSCDIDPSVNNTEKPCLPFTRNDLQVSDTTHGGLSTTMTQWGIFGEHNLSVDDVEYDILHRSLVSEFKGIDEPISCTHIQNFKW